jgi:hypothetical protein
VAVHRTWLVKLRRAKKHLGEFRREVVRLQERERAYRVSTKIETHNDGDWLVVRGWLPVYNGDRLAAVMGDIIFNARSALDHVYVVLSGKPRAQFPFFTADIRKPDFHPTTRQDLSPSRLNGFLQDTSGMPPDAAAFLEKIHPYATHPQMRESDALAILNRLCNADKHRELVVVSQHICKAKCRVTVNGIEMQSVFLPPQRAADGAIVGIFPVPPSDAETHVEVTGGIEVGLQEPGGIVPAAQPWDFTLPDSLVNTVAYVEMVVRKLDSFIP